MAKTKQPQTKIHAKKATNKPATNRFIQILETRAFGRFYVTFALFVLLVSTLFWSMLSARVQHGNADQFVNSYFFESAATFRGALQPQAHSFLLKWPIFLGLRLFGFSDSAFLGFTVGITVASVASLAAILYRILRRPLAFGTLCLALASVLLLVPAQPYPGGILPVNMAMLTTRNLEYVWFIISLGLFVGTTRLKSWRFGLATCLLTLIIASDKLFLTLSLVGASLSLLSYLLVRNWSLVRLSTRWLLGSAIASLMAGGLLAVTAAQGVTHFVGQPGLSPYGFISSVHDGVLGIFYAGLGILTDFGITPSLDTRLIRSLPHQITQQLTGWVALAVIVNVCILLLGLYMVFRCFYSSMNVKDMVRAPDQATKLSILLIWTSVAAIGAFVFSKHYYPVDARYLTITVFTVFIGAAGRMRQRTWRSERLVFGGAIMVIAMAASVPSVIRIHSHEQQALSSLNNRNELIAQVLSTHAVDTLVGDYWRVIPTRQASGNHQKVLPLADCSNPAGSLSSQAWETNLQVHSFAYLLSFDTSLTGYPSCSLDRIIQVYGRPNSSVAIVGSVTNPKELLLFYDQGIRKKPLANMTRSNVSATILPTKLEDLPNPICSGPSVLNIVAHQDDDLLFMSPDLIHDIQAGHCVRTIYITAGDAGLDKFYWLGREEGSEAAYSKMLGIPKDTWVKRIVRLDENQFVTIASPRGNPNVSLVFMHVPDGSPMGHGFKKGHFESLARLEAGQTTQLHTVDDESVYNSSQLITALVTFMRTYRPTDIRTQANVATANYADHSDHMSAGRYVRKAYAEFTKEQNPELPSIPLKFYLGYTLHTKPKNVFGLDLKNKEDAFHEYSKFDGGVCHTPIECEHSAYSVYLPRQYQDEY